MRDKKQIEQQLHELISVRASQDFGEQVAEAIQVIREIGQVDSEKAFLKIKMRIAREQMVGKWFGYAIRIAASLFIPLLMVSGWLFFKLPPEKVIQVSEQQITSPPGARSQMTLPDGSKIWLSSETTLRFNIPFENGQREVYLSGEAFFDVQSNPELPFIVRAGKVAVTVTGTRFNIKAWEEDKTTEVVLEEGVVYLGNLLQAGKNEGIMMNPGEQAIVDKSSGKTFVNKVSTEKYTSWYKGKLIFDETPMQEVALQLERWYGVKVIIGDPVIYKYRITTTFENEPLNQVLELLKISSPIDIRYYPAKLDDNYQIDARAQIIITAKPNI